MLIPCLPRCDRTKDLSDVRNKLVSRVWGCVSFRKRVMWNITDMCSSLKLSWLLNLFRPDSSAIEFITRIAHATRLLCKRHDVITHTHTRVTVLPEHVPAQARVTFTFMGIETRYWTLLTSYRSRVRYRAALPAQHDCFHITSLSHDPWSVSDQCESLLKKWNT